MKTMRSTPVPAPSFRQLLQSELARRCAGNASYSLRAFARRLEIHHSTLSQLLRGRRPLTARTIRRIGHRLGLDPATCEAYARTARAEVTAPSETIQLAQDAARIVADWTHFAILELTRLESFRPDVRWIARVLGITPDEVNVATTRLVRLELLAMKRDSWVDLSGDAVFHAADLGLVALERFASRLAPERAAGRDVAAATGGLHLVTTLAVDLALLPSAALRIERFRDELMTVLAGASRPDAVVEFEVHLTPVTRVDPLTKE